MFNRNKTAPVAPSYEVCMLGYVLRGEEDFMTCEVIAQAEITSPYLPHIDHQVTLTGDNLDEYYINKFIQTPTTLQGKVWNVTHSESGRVTVSVISQDRWVMNNEHKINQLYWSSASDYTWNQAYLSSNRLRVYEHPFHDAIIADMETVYNK